MTSEYLTGFQIDFSSPLPVYEQIKGRIRQAVATGRLQKDDELISIRQLAGILKVNPNTVARAYRDLAAEGILEGRSGVGYRIKSPDSLDSQKILQQKFLQFLEEAARLGIAQQEIRRLVLSHFQKEEPT